MQIVTVGRGPKNDVIIKDDHMVERCHVQFKKDDNGQYSVVDFQTQAGTYVNGKRIQGEVRIQPGDKVQIAKTELPWESYFQDDDRAGGVVGGWSTWSIVLLGLGGLVSLIIVILMSLHMVGVYHKHKMEIQVDTIRLVGFDEYINDSLTRHVLVENLLDSINNARGRGHKGNVKPGGGGATDDDVEVEVIIPYPGEPPVEEEEEEHVAFQVIEQMPEFPGGDSALIRFLSDNVKYPVIAQENGIQGRAHCRFLVDVDGSVRDVHIVKSAGDKSLDKETVRVVSSMPKWKPGMQREKPVAVHFSVVMRFKLE